MSSKNLSLMRCEILEDGVRVKMRSGTMMWTLTATPKTAEITFHTEQGDRPMAWPLKVKDDLQDYLIREAVSDAYVFFRSSSTKRKQLREILRTPDKNVFVPLFVFLACAAVAFTYHDLNVGTEPSRVFMSLSYLYIFVLLSGVSGLFVHLRDKKTSSQIPELSEDDKNFEHVANTIEALFDTMERGNATV